MRFQGILSVVLIGAAALLTVAAGVFGGLLRPADPQEKRKFLVLVVPIVLLSVASLEWAAVSASFYLTLLEGTVQVLVICMVCPVIILGLSGAQVRAFFSQPPQRRSSIGAAIVVAWSVAAAVLVYLQLSTSSAEKIVAVLLAVWPGYLLFALFGPVLEEWYVHGVLWSLCPEEHGVGRKAVVLAVIATAQHVPAFVTLHAASAVPLLLSTLFLSWLGIGYVRGYAGLRWSIALHCIHNGAVTTYDLFA